MKKYEYNKLRIKRLLFCSGKDQHRYHYLKLITNDFSVKQQVGFCLFAYFIDSTFSEKGQFTF